MSEARRPRVVVGGAGFGGLRVAQRLRNALADVLVIDRHNHHTFMPRVERWINALLGMQPPLRHSPPS